MAQESNSDIERFRASTQGATAGAVIGGLLGGPAGALIGASIGASIGDDIARKSGHCKSCGNSGSCSCGCNKK